MARASGQASNCAFWTDGPSPVLIKKGYVSSSVSYTARTVSATSRATSRL